jgi:hypothetical protein
MRNRKVLERILVIITILIVISMIGSLFAYAIYT